MAIDSSGTLWVWGNNSEGALGNGTNVNRPAPYPLATGFKSITAGSFQSLGIRNDGSLWAWGNNHQGKLGDGSEINSNVPVRIGEGFIQVVSNVSSTLALKDDGSLWAWGYNGNGIYGDGTQTQQLLPKLIGYFNFTKLALGNDHVLAIKSDQTLWAWGDNGDGQLGTGNRQGSFKPARVKGMRCMDIMAGGRHSACIKPNGSLWSWGWNGYGQLGTGNTDTVLSPVRVGAGYQRLAQGGYGVDTLMAFKANGSAWITGRNNFGQLGVGQEGSSNRLTLLGYGYTEGVVGNGHTMALKANGSIWAWGKNDFGQVGANSTEQTVFRTPAKIVFADAPIKPVPTVYQSYQGGPQNLYAWEGRYVAILSMRKDLSADVMKKWLTAADNAYQWYWWTTGFRPDLNGFYSRSYNGKAVIAGVPKTYDGAAAVGSFTATGIEIWDHPSDVQHQYFTRGYKNLLDKGHHDTIMFFEMGRNFWNINRMETINFWGGDVRTGYAVAMLYFSMKAGGLAVSDETAAYFTNLESMVDYYADDPSQNWGNTLAVWKSQANNPAGLDAPNLYAAFLIRLHRDYGGQEFLTRFWQESIKRPVVQSPNDAVNNFFVAASIAAKRNLTTLFTQQWRWPVSPSAQAEVSIYPAG